MSPDSFNDYFVTVDSKLGAQCDDTPRTWDLPQSMYIFDLKPTEADFIKKQFINYNDRSNHDTLVMDFRLLKIGVSVIISFLFNIFNIAEITIQYQSLVT